LDEEKPVLEDLVNELHFHVLNLAEFEKALPKAIQNVHL
jgi:hypothetical protein